MIDYRNTTLVWIIVTLIFFISGLRSNLLYGYLFISLIYVTALIIGSVNIKFKFYLKSIVHGAKANPNISLTFDDGPDNITTLKILEILNKYDVKGTFFCIGQKIESNSTLIKQMVEQGHIIGNHSYSHSFWFDFFSPKKMVRELVRTNDLIFHQTGKKAKLFRPPYGVTNPFLSKALKKTKHTSVAWSLRSFDTNQNEGKVLNNLKQKLTNGDIILFHDTSEVTGNILEEFILFAKNKGKRFVGLDELLNIDVYED